MTASCHPFPADAAQSFFALATRALCDHPGEARPDAEARTRQMVHTALGFEPRDGLEFMLSTLVYGQLTLILDAIHDVFHAEPGPAKHRARSGVVALNRALLSTLRELCLRKARPLAQCAKATQAETAPKSATPPPGPRPAAEAKPPPQPPSRPIQPHPAQPHLAQPHLAQPHPPRPEPTRPMPEHPFLIRATPGPDDDTNLAAIQKAHAEARKTLAETIPRARA